MSKLEMLTPQNSAIAMIDYQPAMYQSVQPHDRLETGNVRQHSFFLAKAAKDLMSFAMNGAEDRNGPLT
jgi:hypothetical protein